MKREVAEFSPQIGMLAIYFAQKTVFAIFMQLSVILVKMSRYQSRHQGTFSGIGKSW